MKDIYIILIPFLGTSLGAACVFFMKNSLSDSVERSLTGFAAGVMIAASVWSLLIPAIEQSENMGKWSFIPAVTGFWAGVLFLLSFPFALLLKICLINVSFIMHYEKYSLIKLFFQSNISH